MPKTKQKSSDSADSLHRAGSAYWPLFQHLSVNHGLTLLESEMEDICRVVEQMRSAQAWAVQHKSGRITLGSESTPQLYCHRYRAAEMAKELKAHIGQCRVVRVNYRITPNEKS
jgi:hypothetical protein